MGGASTGAPRGDPVAPQGIVSENIEQLNCQQHGSMPGAECCLAESCILLKPEAPAFRIMHPDLARSDPPPIPKVEKVGVSGRGEHRDTPG